MEMDARTFESKMNYYGMERDARKLLIKEKLASEEDVALMTCVDVCEKILESYEVVACESEEITIVRREDMDTYNSITKYLSR